VKCTMWNKFSIRQSKYFYITYYLPLVHVAVNFIIGTVISKVSWTCNVQ